jgi:translation initiation factor 5B
MAESITNIRSPIVVTVGHVDHGKTTLLDKIRGSTVTEAEPGLLTQHVGASYVPISTIEKISGDLLQKMKIKIEIPGLLLIDTPGHAAFITLRKRGGAVSDLAILVVDVTEGFQNQTDESLAVLKEYKTPFIVAATKIDKIQGWFPEPGHTFLKSFEKQREHVKEEVEKRIYNLVQQLAERGFNSERFDRVEDFTKNIAIVPCSGITGEGIPELLMVLAGLAQTFLKDRLHLSETGRGAVLEVKDVKGFGTTIDVILFDGKIRKGDWIVIGGKEPIATKIKVLLEPPPLRELRIEKQFVQTEEVSAAAGIKIVAPDLENVGAGSPLIVVENEKEIEEAKAAVQQEIQEVEFTNEREGIVLKADTLGSLEAMIKLVEDAGIPVRKAEVGSVTKQDVIEVQNLKEDIRKVVLAFNVKILDDAETFAKDLDVTIFSNNIIYRLIDEYKEWSYKAKEREIQQKLSKVSRPCEIKVLKGFVFRVSNPAIFGVEVRKGLLKPGVRMKREDGKEIGVVKTIEKEGQQISEAKTGDKVAISMSEPTIGRQIEEGNVLITVLTETDLKILHELFEHLSVDERELLKEYS